MQCGLCRGPAGRGGALDVPRPEAGCGGHTRFSCQGRRARPGGQPAKPRMRRG
jgi:hypothetical protein